MKLKLVVLFWSLGTIYAMPLFSQLQKLNVSYSNVSLTTVLNDLKAKTGYQFLYYEDIMTADAKVNVTRNNATLEEILDEVLTGNGLTFAIQDNVILITRAQVKTQERVQQSRPVSISGTVKDNEGNPLIGVAVVVKGTTRGLVTDAAGQYSINVTPNDVLVFSFVGMRPVEIVYTGQGRIDVQMEVDASQIDDVVVTGIFDRPRESYTGAVTTITKQQLETYRGQNLIQTLRNIDPAINLYENNEWGSDPNRLPEMSIRGSSSLPRNLNELNEGVRNDLNTPLIIMDGFEISLQKLMDYNDDEIQSINLLKDASATAIYGSRGANGVIVISSRQPAQGRLRVNLKATFDVEIPDLTSYDLMDAAEKLQFEWDNGFYEYPGRPTSDRSLKETYYRRLRDVLEGTDTYWLSKPLRTGFSQKYNLRLEGGSEEFRWGLTTAYGRTAGVMKNSDRDNFNGQIVLQYNYKNLTFRNQTEVGINKGRNSNYGTFSDYSSMNPYYKVYDEEGVLIKTYGTNQDYNTIYNPLYNASLKNIDESGYTELINNFSIEWAILDGLTLRGRFGISKKTETSDNFISPEHTMFLDDEYSSGDGILRRGRYTYGSGESSSYDGNVTLGYTKVFNGKHQLYSGLNYTVSQNKYSIYRFVGEGFTNENVNSIIAARNYAQNGKPTGSEDFTRLLGFTGNANYTYDNRYYADASFRIDGSSQFGSEKRFAPFWSAGIGWNLHNEEFMKNNSIFNNLRLKFSYGQTGSQQFGAYQALSKFAYYTGDRYGNWGGAYLDGLGNDELKWQITDQFNVGTEIGIFQNRINLSFDYYVKKTSNLLSDLYIPYVTGFNSFVANVGEVRNNGFEASLSGYLIRDTARDIAWTLTAKIAYNKNEITKLSEAIKIQNEQYLQEDVDVAKLYYEGYSQNSIYAVRSLGIDPSTGNEVFLDRFGNVTDTWRPSDKVYMGVGEPKYRGNVGTMFRYKDLSLNLSFGYQLGGYAYNQTVVDKVELLRGKMLYQNLDRRVSADRWSAPGDVAKYKRIPARGEEDILTRASSRFVMKNNLFQLQAVSVEYRLHTEWLRKGGIDNARIAVNMSDVFNISSIKRERGTSYPFARRIGGSVSLMF